MNETERIELLKAVAECAPKEMGALLADWGERYVEFTKCECTSFDERLGYQSPNLYLDGSIDDAAPCFAMLDAMEKAGLVRGCEGGIKCC